MEWTALENQIMQNRCKLLEMCFQDSLKKPCRMLTSFAVLSPRSIADRGVQCMMTGYATDHEGDCYRMWDPKTKGIHETRDVIWMKRMYYEKDIGQGIIVPPMIITGIDDPPLNQEGTNFGILEAIDHGIPEYGLSKKQSRPLSIL